MHNAQMHLLRVQRSARYAMLGQLGQGTQEVWFTFHGYGQLVQYFIRNFQSLDDGSRVIVAPEGLSRFYLDNAYDRIGASWLTREDRENEILDMLAYLEQVYQGVLKGYDLNRVKINLFGFSQGGATAWRLATLTNLKFDNLVVWAGAIPLPISPEAVALFQEHKLVLAMGSEDPFLTPQWINPVKEGIAEARLPHIIYSYTGGHTIPEEALRQVLNLL